MEKISVSDIQRIIGGQIIGDQKFLVSNISSVENIKDESIVFIRSKKYIPSSFPISILLIINERLLSYIKKLPRSVICVDNVDIAFLKLLKTLHPYSFPVGISDSAVLKKNVVFGENVYIGENVFVGENTVLEENVKIFPYTYIGNNVKIGKNTVIHPHVTILDNVQIGKDCIIQSGCVLGEEGFGYIKVDGKYEKIPQIGRLVIEDEVEIGALSVIDRGAIEDTVIKKGTKIDSLVKIAHNVIVGENNAITAQVGIAGSSKTGKNVIMGGQSGIADHITVGDNVIIAADSGVISDLSSGSFVSGSPAIDHMKEYKAKALMYKLPEIVNEIRELKKEIKKMKEKK